MKIYRLNRTTYFIYGERQYWLDYYSDHLKLSHAPVVLSAFLEHTKKRSKQIFTNLTYLIND